MNIIKRLKRVLPYAAIGTASLGLASCLQEVIPLMHHASSLGGEVLGKSVQSMMGAPVSAEFSLVDGEASAPAPFALAKRVAVWPGNHTEVPFANRLSASGKYQVTPPDTVAAILRKAGVSTELRMLADQEQQAAFTRVCKQANVEQVYAARPLGQEIHTGSLLTRATRNDKYELLVFSCKDRAVAWREPMTVIVATATGDTASADEVNQVGGEAWADRLMQAQGYTSPSPTGSTAAADAQ